MGSCLHHLGNHLSGHQDRGGAYSADAICGITVDRSRGDLCFLLKLRGNKLPSRRDLIHISVVGISLIGVGNGLVVTGEQYVGSGLAALLITTVPFWVVGMEAFIPTGPKLNLGILSGLLLGLIGVTLIFNGNGLTF